MNRLEKILAIIAIILAVVVGVLWLKPDLLPNHRKSGEFKDIQALGKSDLVSLDLIPDWLPASASDIKITQNTGNGSGFLFFRFSEDDTAALRDACPRILKPLPALPQALDADWKPADPDAFYLCPKGMLAIDGKQRSALLWR